MQFVFQDAEYVGVRKSVFAGSEIYMKIKCDPGNETGVNIGISWMLRKTPCWKEYLVADVSILIYFIYKRAKQCP